MWEQVSECKRVFSNPPHDLFSCAKLRDSPWVDVTDKIRFVMVGAVFVIMLHLQCKYWVFIFPSYLGAKESYFVPSAQICWLHWGRSTDFEAFSYLLPSIEFGTLSCENKGGKLLRLSCVKSPIKYSWLQESRQWRGTVKINQWHDSNAQQTWLYKTKTL